MATFNGKAAFHGATFSDPIQLRMPTNQLGDWGAVARAEEARAVGAVFAWCKFRDDARFEGVDFGGDARFDRAEFALSAWGLTDAQLSGSTGLGTEVNV